MLRGGAGQQARTVDFSPVVADDCLIFTQASKKGADRVAAILDDYNKDSRQLVNKNKSVVFFSPNCQ